MPKYSPETVKQYRTDQLTKARVNDQLGFARVEDKDGWWKVPLAALGGRSPSDFYSSDPLAVFLCAKYGITACSESSPGITEDSYDSTIDDDLIGEAPLVVGQPIIVSASDSGVRDTVSADELDALRSSDEGQSSKPVVPDWWT